jgi:hypothetical protein
VTPSRDHEEETMAEEKLPPEDPQDPSDPGYEPPSAEVIADEGSAATAAWVSTGPGQ